MNERYSPSSDFLCALINDEVSLSGSAFAEGNLARLIGLTSDEDVANRDWATFLLAQLELDRPDVRQALTAAAADQEGVVRAEAILGLAQLDCSLALPLVQRELAGETVYLSVLEAAEMVADSSLIPDLEAFTRQSSGINFLDEQAIRALDACKGRQ